MKRWSAEPMPYQPVIRWRFWLQPNTQGWRADRRAPCAETAGRPRAYLQQRQLLDRRWPAAIIGDQAGIVGEPVIGGLGDACEGLQRVVEIGVVAWSSGSGRDRAVGDDAGRQQFHLGERRAAIGDTCT